MKHFNIDVQKRVLPHSICASDRHGSRAIFNRLRRFLFFSSVAAMVLSAAPRHEAAAHLANATFPLLSDHRSAPDGVLRVGKLFRSSHRKGFLRVGVLPLVRADKVAIEVRSRQEIKSVLRRAALCLTSGKSVPLEMTDVRIALDGATLTAASVYIRPGQPWVFKSVTVIVNADRESLSEVRLDSSTLAFTSENSKPAQLAALKSFLLGQK